jgi:hypothetical protein
MDYSETGDVTGTLVATNDIVIPPGAEASTSNSGCEASDFAPASATEPQVALIQRGTCDFRSRLRTRRTPGMTRRSSLTRASRVARRRWPAR